MAATYNCEGYLKFDIKSVYTKIKSASASPVETIRESISKTFTYGKTTGLAEVAYCDEITIAASGTSTLDLNALVSEVGGTIPLLTIRHVVIEHSTVAATAQVNIGNAAATIWSAWCSSATATTPLHPGGVLALSAPAAGYAVDSSHKLLKFANADSVNAVVVKIWIVGTISA